MKETLRREARVAFSKKAQPVWFRVVKWVLFLGITAALFRTGYFWYWLAGISVIALGLHLFYRWKTHGWTQPYGMWDDVEAGRD